MFRHPRLSNSISTTAAVLATILGGLSSLLATAPAVAVDIIYDIEYESPGSSANCEGGPCNRLDLYLPDGGIGADMPTMMYIHGGGWDAGDKTQFSAGMTVFAEAGYPGVSCNYTLATQDTPSYPQVIHDVKAVVRWIRTVGVETYGLPTEIVVLGASAGGHLSMMVGATAGVGIFEPLPPPPGPDGYRVNGMLPLWGVSDFTKAGDMDQTWRVAKFLGVPWSDPPAPVYTEASPLTWVDATDVSAWFFHGRLDTTCEQSQVMHDALRAGDVWSEIMIDETAGHGFWVEDVVMAEILLEAIPIVYENDRGDACCVDGSCSIETEADCAALGGVWFGPDSDCMNNPCGSGPLHVDSIVVSVESIGGGYRQGRAEVTILDEFGSAVEGALVRGIFSGDYTEIASDVTDIDGVATILTANGVHGKTEFVFCVYTVTDDELYYDAATDVETCDFVGDGPPTGGCCVDALCSIETEADCAAIGGAWLGADSDCSGNPCGGEATLMHVGSIDVSAQKAGGRNRKGRADVTILDELGSPVAGANVIGTFTGDYAETVSAVTGGDGVATILTTSTVSGKPHFEFCVDDVTHAELLYEPADNVETCDSR